MTTPTDRLLTGALLVAPLVYLAADTTYAARGWDDATGGVLHVLGAIAYGFVVLRVASWLPRESKLAAWILFTGLVGMVGNAAYGFEAIHMSLGDTQLVDQPGAANLIKPLGLFFPLSFALVAVGADQAGPPLAGRARAGGDPGLARGPHRQPPGRGGAGEHRARRRVRQPGLGAARARRRPERRPDADGPDSRVAAAGRLGQGVDVRSARRWWWSVALVLLLGVVAALRQPTAQRRPGPTPAASELNATAGQFRFDEGTRNVPRGSPTTARSRSR